MVKKKRGIKRGITSAYKGVHYEHRRNRYRATINTDGRSDRTGEHIGYFVTALEAAKAWDMVAFEKGFSIKELNFPKDFENVVMFQEIKKEETITVTFDFPIQSLIDGDVNKLIEIVLQETEKNFEKHIELKKQKVKAALTDYVNKSKQLTLEL